MPVSPLLGDLGLDLGLGLGIKKPLAYPPLPEAEQRSLIAEALNAGVGGLQWLGETLDKPGRAVRGVLSGDPSAALNLIPFSDTLGITNPSQSVSGRDLLEQAGMLAPNQQGLDWGDAAGFGAEMLLDPLTPLTAFGRAVGTAGKVGKAAGLPMKGLERTKTLREGLKASNDLGIARSAARAAKQAGTRLRDVLDEPMGGLFGLHVPFTNIDMVPQMARGPAAQKVMQGIDAGLGWLGETKPALFAKGLFDYSSGWKGQMTREGQLASRAAYAAARKAKPRAEMEVINAADSLKSLHDDFSQAFGQDAPAPEVVSQMAQLAAELRTPTGAPDVNEAFNRFLPGVQAAQPLKDKLGSIVQSMADVKDHYANSIIEKGGKLNKLLDDPAAAEFQHFPRYLEELQKGKPDPERLRILRQSFESQLARTPATRFLSANTRNAILEDLDILASLKDDDTGVLWTVLKQKYGPELARAAQNETAREAQNAAKAPEMITGAMKKQLRELGHAPAEINKMNPADAWGIIQAAHPPQVHDVDDIVSGLDDWLRSGVKARLSEDAMGNFARNIQQSALVDANLEGIHHMISQNIVPRGVPLVDAFKMIGLDETAVPYFVKKFGPPALQQGVDPKAILAAQSFYQKTQPKSPWLEKILAVTDGVTQLWKKNVTLPFFSFLSRNLGSGQGMWLLSNEIPTLKDAGVYAKYVGKLPDILKNPERYKRWIDLAHAYGALPKEFESLGVPLASQGMAWAPNALDLSGLAQNFRTGFSQAREATANLPRGVRQVATALDTPSQIGALFNRQVEWANRLPGFMYLIEHKGYTPGKAAEITRQLQVAYEELTPFEREVMQRVMPFYTYQRKIVPVMLRQIAARPGGATAQLVRASNVGRSDSEFIPSYIGEGMSVPLGENSYLSQLGLPTDILGELAATGPTPYGTIRRTLQKSASQLHPLVKLPIELGTGTNLFTGKPLSDLYQYPTDNLVLNQLIGDSPLGRAVTTIRQATDDRKTKTQRAVNLLTGAKVATPSGGVEREKQRAAKSILDEILREQPGIGNVTDLYVKQGQKLEPKAEKLYRAYRGITTQERKAAKARKKKAAAG